MKYTTTPLWRHDIVGHSLVVAYLVLVLVKAPLVWYNTTADPVMGLPTVVQPMVVLSRGGTTSVGTD